MQKKVWFYNSTNEKISGLLFYKDKRKKYHSSKDKCISCSHNKYPAIVFCHGFTSSKYSKISIANKISKKGFVVLIFDAAGHGESGGDFIDHTVTKYIDEVKSAVEFLKSQNFVDSNRIGIIGTSLGGMVTVVYASKHKPKAIISVCAPTVLTKMIGPESLMKSELLKGWKKKGFAKFYVRMKKGRDPKILSYNFMKDANRYNLAKVVRKVKCPVMIVHGDSDKNVLVDNAHILFKNASKRVPKEMVIVKGAGHRFKGKYEDMLANIIANGFRKYL